ncbi:MAG: Spy/CpxP family protein refolding chaperone [Deltaproteobacteria bacterium]|nr:Spy/CpxP family protein refolding chaperone [Deltaproteobacteria bacterium]
MKKMTILTISILFVFLAGVAAAASPGAGRTGKGDRLAWLKDVNLTEEQRGKIQSLRQSLKDDILPLRNEMIKKRTELKLLWMEDDPDGAKIKAKQREIRELRAKMEDRLTDFRLEFRKILTPEQRAKIPSFKFGRGSHRSMGKRPGPGR